MSTFLRILKNDAFFSDYFVYETQNGDKVIYDTGAGQDYATRMMIRMALPDEVQGQINLIRCYRAHEIVLLTKDAISYEDALPDFAGRTVYTLPIKTFVMNVPVVTVSINGLEQDLLFDTGAPCLFTVNQGLLTNPVGSSKTDWLALEHQFAELELYSAQCHICTGFDYTTHKLVSLADHSVYLPFFQNGCKGIIGIEKLDEYDICINKDEAILFVKRD